MGEREQDQAAIRAAHEMLEVAQIISGHLVLSPVAVLGWTMKHAAAINRALPKDEAEQRSPHD